MTKCVKSSINHYTNKSLETNSLIAKINSSYHRKNMYLHKYISFIIAIYYIK